MREKIEARLDVVAALSKMAGLVVLWLFIASMIAIVMTS